MTSRVDLGRFSLENERQASSFLLHARVAAELSAPPFVRWWQRWIRRNDDDDPCATSNQSNVICIGGGVHIASMSIGVYVPWLTLSIL